MTKQASQLQNLQTAAKRLQEALEYEKNDMVRDAVIQRFEFTFELTWKIMSSILRKNGMEFRGIKTVFRDAARVGLLDDVELWFSYLDARNLTTHTYDLEVAEKVYQQAKAFSQTLQTVLPKLADL